MNAELGNNLLLNPCLTQKSANNNSTEMLNIREIRWSWRLIGVPIATCEYMSPAAKIQNSVITIVLFSEAILNGLMLKIEKYAPKQKNKIVCGINAL